MFVLTLSMPRSHLTLYVRAVSLLPGGLDENRQTSYGCTAWQNTALHASQLTASMLCLYMHLLSFQELPHDL